MPTLSLKPHALRSRMADRRADMAKASSAPIIAKGKARLMAQVKMLTATLTKIAVNLKLETKLIQMLKVVLPRVMVADLAMGLVNLTTKHRESHKPTRQKTCQKQLAIKPCRNLLCLRQKVLITVILIAAMEVAIAQAEAILTLVANIELAAEVVRA